MKKPQHNRQNPRHRRGPEHRADHHHGHAGHPEARNPDDARGEDADDGGGRQGGAFRLASALDDLNAILALCDGVMVEGRRDGEVVALLCENGEPKSL